MHVGRIFRCLTIASLLLHAQSAHSQINVVQPDTSSHHMDITDIENSPFTLPDAYVDFVIELIDDYPDHYQASLGNFDLKNIQNFNELLEPEDTFHLTLLDYFILNMNPDIIEHLNKKFLMRVPCSGNMFLKRSPKPLFSVIRKSQKN
ncbi:MAG: hypothetical protein R2877_03285 [Bdellovibrionota bacterium]